MKAGKTELPYYFLKQMINFQGGLKFLAELFINL